MKPENKPSINYTTDGNGRWWRTEIDPKCDDEDIFGLSCQGVLGHKGVHWAYSPNGSYTYWLNESDPTSIEENIGAGSIPPDHESYIHPNEKREDYYMRFRKTTEVNDSDLIEKLEKEETPEDDASVDRPLTSDEVEILKGRGIL